MQKTAYEVRISDWSSDVCSSDLPAPVEAKHRMARRRHALRQHRHPAMRAAANLVAARHDQQAGRARRVVERRGKHRAFALEVQMMPHVFLNAGTQAAASAAIGAYSRTRKARG